MSYVVVEDFKLGMDRRRDRASGAPGALWLGKNVHITRGGDIQRRKKFVEFAELPEAQTYDLAAVSGQLFVFGPNETPSGMPPEVVYQRLQHPDDEAMTSVLSWTTFDGKLYAAAEYEDGAVYHYYDGARATEWDDRSTEASSLEYCASALAEKIDSQAAYTATAVGAVVRIVAATPGTPFTIAKTAVNGSGGTDDQDITLAEIQANVEEEADARAECTITVTAGTEDPGVNTFDSITINGVDILGATVDWAISNSATAAALAAQINAFETTPVYTATVVGSTITVRAAAGTGSGPNGYLVVVNTSGDAAATPTNMAGGGFYVEPVAQVYTATLSGTFDANDTFTITLDGDDYRVTGGSPGMGRFVLTFQEKLYSTLARLLGFSGIGDPTVLDPASVPNPGAGVINMTNQNDGFEALTALAEYQGKLAIFSPNTVRTWVVDPDPDNNRPDNSVPNTGTVAPRSVRAYGNLDVFYLDTSGVRSLRARDSSNAPAVNDIGVPIDPFIQEYLATLTEEQVRRACSVIEPTDGRFWLCVGNRIFVLSSFAGAKVNAWSYYDLSDEIDGDIDAVLRVGKRTYLRSGDKIYLYGGTAGTTYPDDDEIEADVILPFLSAKTPGTMKFLRGVDVSLSGVWDFALLPDPARPEVEMPQGTFAAPTSKTGMNASLGHSAAIGARLRCSKAGQASISSIIIHYGPGEAT